MNKQEREFLEEIYEECVELEGKRDLTEHGAGEGDLIVQLLGKDREPFRFVS